jgi:hypothetical protein
MSPEVDKIMAARKKNCPLVAKFAPIKGKHKALSNRSIFKGDIEGPLKDYDEAVKAYADAREDQKKLVDSLNTMFNNLAKISTDQDKLKADRDKNEDEIENNKEWDQAQKYKGQPDADPQEVVQTLNNFATSIQKSFDLHKRVMDQIIAVGSNMINVVKQGRDDYKSKADKVNSTLQKAYDDSDKAQSDALAAITDGMDTADEIENDDLKKSLQGLYKLVSG